jgi:hypothetical protein
MQQVDERIRILNLEPIRPTCIPAGSLTPFLPIDTQRLRAILPRRGLLGLGRARCSVGAVKEGKERNFVP